MLDNTETFTESNVLANTEEEEEFYSAESSPSLVSPVISKKHEKKYAKIEQFLQHNGPNLQKYLSKLRGFATSEDGLADDVFRQKIWPILAENLPSSTADENNTMERKIVEEKHLRSGLHRVLSTFYTATQVSKEGKEMLLLFEETIKLPIEELRLHKEWNQVQMDVNRTLARFPPNITDTRRQALQDDLTPLIVSILSENPSFSYYQGFHDVCLTLILALGAAKALNVARTLARRSSLARYLEYSLEEGAMSDLRCMYALLYSYDKKVERHLRKSELGSMFALSWPLTWFSHDLQHYSQIVLFFDLFLSSHPMMPIYVSAALIAERREEILRHKAGIDSMPMLHQLLSKIPSEINVTRILETSQRLFVRFPPSTLIGQLKQEYEKMCKHKLEKLEKQLQKVQPDVLPEEKKSGCFPF